MFALKRCVERSATADQMKFIFSSNKNVLELDNGDVCAILYMD